MRRSVAALAALTIAFSAQADAETTRERDCTVYCAEKAVEKCDDVTSTWCNAYIVGCLAGCGIAHL